MYKAFILFLLLVATCAVARTRATATAADTVIYSSVDVAPRFPGGEKKMDTFIGSHFDSIQLAKRDVAGTVYAEVIIQKEGTISDMRIARSLDPLGTKKP